jgi:hypothetical protein
MNEQHDIESCERFLVSIYKHFDPRQRSAAIVGYKQGILRHDGRNWLKVSEYLDDVQDMQIYYEGYFE